MRRIPRGTITVSVATLATGLWLRLGDFYYLQQLCLAILFAGIVALAFLFFVSALWKRWRHRSRTSFFSVGVLAVTALLLLACSFESDRANARKNNAYLGRLAEVVIEYESVNGQVPESFAQALDASRQRLPNRGDADGRAIVFERTGEHAFSIRSTSRANVFAEYHDGKLSTGNRK